MNLNADGQSNDGVQNNQAGEAKLGPFENLTSKSTGTDFTPEELQKHLSWRQQEGLPIAPNQKIQNEELRQYLATLKEKQQIIYKHAPPAQISNLKEKVDQMLPTSSFSSGSLSKSKEKEQTIAQKATKSSNSTKDRTKVADSDAEPGYKIEELQSESKIIDEHIQKQMADGDDSEIQNSDQQESNFTEEELKEFREKAVDYIVFLEAQFYQDSQKERAENMQKTMKERENKRKSQLFNEMQNIKQQCYEVYKTHNPGKPVPKEQIDDTVKRFINRFHSYTKLNSMDLQNSVALFQSDLKNDNLLPDGLDYEPTEARISFERMSEKQTLRKRRQDLEKQFERTESTDDVFREKQNNSLSADKLMIPGQPEKSRPITEAQIRDAVKFDEMDTVLTKYHEQISSCLATLKAKTAERESLSQQGMANPMQMKKLESEIGELEGRQQRLKDEMFQIIDNMAFLSKILQGLRSGLPVQLDQEQRKFLQRLVAGKASQVFDALDQIDINIDDVELQKEQAKQGDVSLQE